MLKISSDKDYYPTPESLKEFAKWVLHDVVSSIFTKGYYKIGE